LRHRPNHNPGPGTYHPPSEFGHLEMYRISPRVGTCPSPDFNATLHVDL